VIKHTELCIFQMLRQGWSSFAGCPECDETVYAKHDQDGYLTSHERLFNVIGYLEFWPNNT